MIGIIGAGTLGSVIARRLSESKEFAAGGIIVADRNKGKLALLAATSATTTTDSALAVQKSGTVILCVKPKDMDSLLSQIGGLCEGKLVISAAAGVSLSYLEARAPGARIIRCMPNLAAAYGKSDTAVSFSKSIAGSDRKTAEGILRCLGNVHCIEEGKMAAWTGLSGSFPAYVAAFIDSAAKAAESQGFGRKESVELAASVTRATASLLLESGEDPSALVARVASPGGTTEAGLKIAQENGLQEKSVAVLAAAINRAKEMER